FTDVDIVGRLGEEISAGIESVKEQGFSGLFEPSAESLKNFSDAVSSIVDSDSSALSIVRQELGNISFASESARESIMELLDAAIDGDDEALSQLRSSLSDIEGGSRSANSYLRRLLRAAENKGD